MSGLDALPPLREVIARHGLAARRSLGQNFLLDLNLTAKIARAAGDLDGHDVLEIGPGPGGLTRALLAAGARRVLAVERDPRALPALAEIAAEAPGRLSVVEADALDFDPRPHLHPPVRIVANLPYNIGTELLTRWLDPPDGDWPPFWQSATLMFQREVAERITARPGGKAWGRLGVLAAWRSEARIAMTLPPEAFTPPPKVRSSVVNLLALPEPRVAAPRDALLSVVAAAFQQRRKMLRQSLRRLAPDIDALLARVGIDPTRRPETLTLEEFAAIARAL